jgi:hypothetical protein
MEQDEQTTAASEPLLVPPRHICRAEAVSASLVRTLAQEPVKDHGQFTSVEHP